MALTKISGELLESNLIRTTDLDISSNVHGALLHVDVANGRIGVNNDTPGNFSLDVNGATRIQGDLTVTGTTTTIDSQNLTVEDNILVINHNASASTDAGLMINRGSSQDPAVFYWDETDDVFKLGTTTSDGSTQTDLSGVTLAKMQIGEPSSSSDAATKNYVDSQISSSSTVGTSVTIGTPTDSSFGDGSLTTLGDENSVTDALDSLNETMENIRNSTYVKSVTFTSSSTSISLGDTVNLSITTVPAAGANTRYTITWGDGVTETVGDGSTLSYSHPYNESSGSPMTVTVKAFDNTATTDSAGSFAEFTRTNYISIATAAPVVSFAMYAASSGGSPITSADNGSTVYLQNNTTNTASTNTFDVDWGDGTTQTIANDSADGGKNGGRLSHTYTNSATDDGTTVSGTGAGDTKYKISLRLLTHPTANAETFPQTASSNFEVYSVHTPKINISDSTVRGVNESGTSGFPVTFINGTDSNPGANSSFSATQQYQWDFTDDSTQTTVAIGSGSSGDTGQTISKTFGFTQSGSGTQGSTTTYPVKLVVNSGHTTGVFTSAITNIIVEPDVRAVLAATANTVSTGSSDNQYDLYDLTDLDGTNRALATFTNTSQNASDYEYDFFNDSTDALTVQEDGSTAGTIGTALQKNFSGTSAGNFTTDFRATGTPDTIHQNSNATINWQMNSTPSAPANLSSKSLTLSDSAQGTSPKLCHGFTDNSSSFTSQSAGDSLDTTTARRYTSTSTIDTATVTNFLTNSSNGTGSTVNQTVTAKINNGAKGARTFTTSEGGSNNTTDDTLVTTNHRDYDEVDGSYPQRVYLVATAKITEGLTDYSVGSNAQRIESSAGGNTNIVHVVRDDVTATPTVTIGTVTQNAAGTLRYISGVPYYNTGSPSLTVTGSTVANFTGQAFQDTTSPVEIDPGTTQEGASGHVISNLDFTYADIDGSTTMLSGSTPKANIGVGGAYTLGALTVPLLSTQRRAIQTIKMKAKNCNGDSSYSETSTKIQLYTNTLLALDNEAGGITVSDSLGDGSTHTDDAVRVSGFGSLSGDTPDINDSSNANYYTDSAWSGAVAVAGTNEAISRFGTISHFTTDLSSGYLPVGPDLNTGRSGAQYFTFAFRRTPVSQFSITMSGKVSGMFIACPGTDIDNSSGSNGWLDCSTQYNGSGQPGSGTGGNGSDGCAKTGGDRVVDNTTYSSEQFTFTLGTESLANARGNVCLVRIKLESGDSVTALSVGVAE